MTYSTQEIALRGTHRHLHRWTPEAGSTARSTNAHSTCKGIVCIIHGLGEHGGRYHTLATELNQRGLLVLAFDQQGHGKSQEERGCIESYESMLDDIHEFLDWTNREHPEHGIVLFGHSMGGNLALNFALRRPTSADSGLVKGFIASSPMIRAVSAPGPIVEWLARQVMRMAPNFRMHSKVNPAHLMSDPEQQQLLADDLLFHSQLSLRLGGALLESGRWALKSAHTLSSPLLLTHGTDDSRTCPAASEEFASKAGSHCRLQIFDQMKHDPFRDLDRDAVIDVFADFVLEMNGHRNRENGNDDH